jgi:hypothetical protein
LKIAVSGYRRGRKATHFQLPRSPTALSRPYAPHLPQLKQLKTWIDYFLCNFRSLKLIFMGLFCNKGLKNSLMVLQGGFGNLAASE